MGLRLRTKKSELMRWDEIHNHSGSGGHLHSLDIRGACEKKIQYRAGLENGGGKGHEGVGFADPGVGA